MGRQGAAGVARRLLVTVAILAAVSSSGRSTTDRAAPLCALDAAAFDPFDPFDPSTRRQHLPTPARDPAALGAQLELRRHRAKRTLSHYVMPSFHPTDGASVAARQRRREAWLLIGSRGYGAWANKVVEKVVERRFNPRAQLRFMYDVPWCVPGSWRGVVRSGGCSPTSPACSTRCPVAPGGPRLASLAP